jgi:hypothetical protein
MIKRLLALILVLSAVASTQAQQAPSPCSGAGYVVAFFNGMSTTFSAAISEDMAPLQAIYKDQFNNEPVSYYTFYNPTDGFLKDLAESYAQKQQESPEIANRWELLWDLVEGSTDIITLFLTENPTAATVVNTLKNLALNEAKVQAQTLISQANFQPVVNQFASTMTTFLTEQKKIMAVAHSQGNFFVNAVYDIVHPTLTTHSLAIVQVATPTASARGPYTTSDTDLVIKAVAAALGSTLPPNSSGPLLPSEDWMGHSFVGVYMNARYNMFSQIKSNTDAAMAALQPPNTQGSAGLFTVTLTWSGTGDEDLHVIEPNGTHVYYAHKQGFTGFLDVDNVIAFGPEHYFASCDPALIQEGTYQIGINDFRQADGETATVQLVTTQRVFQGVQLSTGPTRGTGGDNSPMPVFTVQVTKNPDGTFTVNKQ